MDGFDNQGRKGTAFRLLEKLGRAEIGAYAAVAKTMFGVSRLLAGKYRARCEPRVETNLARTRRFHGTIPNFAPMNSTTSPNARIGVLLVNLGTPDSPNTPDVRRYLNEFLTDGRVVDMPAAIRYPLFQGLVVPLRAPKSAKIYQELWTERGSPLLFHGLDLQEKVQAALGERLRGGLRHALPEAQH